jgi:hypothetical protein
MCGSRQVNYIKITSSEAMEIGGAHFLLEGVHFRVNLTSRKWKDLPSLTQEIVH